MSFCCINQHLNKSGSIRCSQCNSLIAGALISDYKVVSYIGKGSTSDVYLAEQHSLQGRKVVIKILHRSCSEEHIDSFRSEAKLLASLSHPYILPIFSYGVIHEHMKYTSNYVPYLVIQFAEQGSLAESFERQGNRPWSPERVVSIAQDVAEALDYAHSHNVLHRDIKPANILQIGSHVLLSDFSVASLIDADASHLSIGLAGSPAFMAPEVWEMRPGRYSDQYSLAITCFFLLTGKYPLGINENTSMRSWQQAHCYTAPAALNTYRADLPPAVNVVLQKAMAKNPHERYPTLRAFAFDFLEASQEITQQLDAHTIFVRSPLAKIHSASGNRQANERALEEVQPVGISLANAAGTEPIAIPVAPSPTKQTYTGQARINKPLSREVDTEILKIREHGNRWVWCALILNIFIYIMLMTEYTLVMRTLSFNIGSLLMICPALLVGLLLALPFKRIALPTLSWGLLWGIVFGLTNALLSLFACMVWYILLPFASSGGAAGVTLSGFFGPFQLFAADPNIVVLLLLALWVSVIGGAMIGILNIQGGDAKRIIHLE